ncbi:MAG TPA: SRPBCC domain-containing protein [Paraburkholderia sp.]
MSAEQYLVTSIKVEINAPASLVWDVLTDLAAYPQWNPYTVKVESTLKLGDPVNLFLPNPAAPGELIHVIEHLAAFDRPSLLSWEMTPSAGNPDAARRDQVIEATGEASCTYYSTDLFLGPTAPTVMATHGEWVRQGFDAVARSLKTRAESLYQAQAPADTQAG